MRILRLIPYFTYAFGGPVHHVRMLTRQLGRLGNETVVYTTNLADKSGAVARFEEDEIEVHAFPVRWSVGDYFYSPEMGRALRREEFDLIHAHCYRNYQSDLAARVSRRTQKPLLFTAHGTLAKLPNTRDRILKGLYDALSRHGVLRQSSRVIALSVREMNQYRHLGVPHGKIVRIYHGVDHELFRPGDNGDEIRSRFRLGEGPVILYVGRIHERKGLQHLILALRNVRREFPDARLLVCGPDYGYRDKLYGLVRDAGVGDRVVFTGAMEHHLMPQVYGAADIVILPAQYEVFGHTLAEAASCGKAIVATKWGWAAEFFEDQEECILIDAYGDISGLTRTLATLLGDAGLRAKLGRKAREKVLRSLSWEACAQQHVSIYEQALSARRPSR